MTGQLKNNKELTDLPESLESLAWRPGTSSLGGLRKLACRSPHLDIRGCRQSWDLKKFCVRSLQAVEMI